MPVIDEYSVTQADKTSRQTTEQHGPMGIAMEVEREPHLLFRDDDRNRYFGTPVTPMDLQLYQDVVNSRIDTAPSASFYAAAMDAADAVAVSLEQDDDGYTATMTIDGDETYEREIGIPEALYFAGLHENGLLRDTANAFSMDESDVQDAYGGLLDGAVDHLPFDVDHVDVPDEYGDLLGSAPAEFDWQKLENGMITPEAIDIPGDDFTLFEYDGWTLESHNDHTHAAQVFVHPTAETTKQLAAVPDRGEYTYNDFLEDVTDAADPYTPVVSQDQLRTAVDLATYDGEPVDMPLTWESAAATMIDAGAADVDAYYVDGADGDADGRYVEIDGTPVAVPDAEAFAQFFPAFTNTLHVAERSMYQGLMDRVQNVPIPFTDSDDDDTLDDAVDIPIEDTSTPLQ